MKNSFESFVSYINSIKQGLDVDELSMRRAFDDLTCNDPQDMREGQLIYSPSVSRGGYTIVIKSGVPGIIIGYFPTEEAAKFFCEMWNLKNS